MSMYYNLCLWHMRRQHFLNSKRFCQKTAQTFISQEFLYLAINSFTLTCHFRKCVMIQVISSANFAIWLAKAMASL